MSNYSLLPALILKLAPKQPRGGDLGAGRKGSKVGCMLLGETAAALAGNEPRVLAWALALHGAQTSPLLSSHFMP